MPKTADGTAYSLSGPVDAPALVLIHGLGLDRSITWGAIAPALAVRYRVLSYDLCGHGHSALPDETPSLAMLSTQLFRLLDALRIERAALIGFSLGGMINRRCAMDRPDRVTALAILNSPHERGDALQAQVEAQARAAGAGGPGATIDAALERWFTPEFHREKPQVVTRVRQVVMANDAENYARHRQVLAEGVVELIRPDPPIAQPTLVMTCENDSGSTSEMSRIIAREIAGAETAIVPGLRHLGLIEQPELFLNPINDFLQRVV